MYGVQDNSDEVARLCLLPPNSIELGSDIRLEMIPIPAKTFMMSNLGRDDDETLNEVALHQPLLIGKYPISQVQWKAMIGTKLS